ncbi:MAG: TM2 domain-containing protein [Bacteroidales bacterium]|nr:TM2 domain-containing protein [Bacteroidales bacterium]
MKKNIDRKTIAGLLGIFFGWAGAHRFYLGKVWSGCIFCALYFFALIHYIIDGTMQGIIWSLTAIGTIDGIRFLVMDETKFYVKVDKTGASPAPAPEEQPVQPQIQLIQENSSPENQDQPSLQSDLIDERKKMFSSKA